MRFKGVEPSPQMQRLKDSAFGGKKHPAREWETIIFIFMRRGGPGPIFMRREGWYDAARCGKGPEPGTRNEVGVGHSRH